MRSTDTQSSLKNHVFLDMYSTLGVECCLALPMYYLMVAHKNIQLQIKHGHMDLDATTQQLLSKYLGMPVKYFVYNPDFDIITDIVSLLCIRNEKGINFNFIRKEQPPVARLTDLRFVPKSYFRTLARYCNNPSGRLSCTQV